MTDSLVTTAAKALDAKLSIVCDHHACDGRCDSAGCVDIRGAAEVVVGAVLAALCHDLQTAVDDYSLLSVRMGGRAWVPLDDMLALLAVVENDQ